MIHVGSVDGIFISSEAGGPMVTVHSVMAIAGAGLEGDRYAEGRGSFSGKPGEGNRQVTLINGIFFLNSGFDYVDSRRNLVVSGVELMWLIGRRFMVGGALFKGVKYCDPCERPSKFANKATSFKKAFFDRGGLIAEVLESGLIDVGSRVITPSKSYD